MANRLYFFIILSLFTGHVCGQSACLEFNSVKDYVDCVCGSSFESDKFNCAFSILKYGLDEKRDIGEAKIKELTGSDDKKFLSDVYLLQYRYLASEDIGGAWVFLNKSASLGNFVAMREAATSPLKFNLDKEKFRDSYFWSLVYLFNQSPSGKMLSSIKLGQSKSIENLDGSDIQEVVNRFLDYLKSTK